MTNHLEINTSPWEENKTRTAIDSGWRQQLLLSIYYHGKSKIRYKINEKLLLYLYTSLAGGRVARLALSRDMIPLLFQFWSGTTSRLARRLGCWRVSFRFFSYYILVWNLKTWNLSNRAVEALISFLLIIPTSALQTM